MIQFKQELEEQAVEAQKAAFRLDVLDYCHTLQNRFELQELCLVPGIGIVRLQIEIAVIEIRDIAAEKRCRELYKDGVIAETPICGVNDT